MPNHPQLKHRVEIRICGGIGGYNVSTKVVWLNTGLNARYYLLLPPHTGNKILSATGVLGENMRMIKGKIKQQAGLEGVTDRQSWRRCHLVVAYF